MVWSHNEMWMVTADHAGYVKYWQSNMNNVKMFLAHQEAIRGIRYLRLISEKRQSHTINSFKTQCSITFILINLLPEILVKRNLILILMNLYVAALVFMVVATNCMNKDTLILSLYNIYEKITLVFFFL